MRIGLVAPHIFMQDAILPNVIFSPGTLAIDLADELTQQGESVILYTPGTVTTQAENQTADLSLFEAELQARGDSYVDLLKKHPLTFISLARQVQAELIAKAYADANAGKLDIVHIYMNEEDIALPFTEFCQKPVVFTHHDPFSFLVKYRSVFPKYKQLNWLSMSRAQRAEMPPDTNWVGNIYHGLKPEQLQPVKDPQNNYVAYLGRIIEPKGVHIAIAAVKHYNAQTGQKLKLKLAGKHYSGAKDDYWQRMIVPEFGDTVEYIGYIKNDTDKQTFLGNARALLVPSTFNEPFGMVMIEALACGTPVIGLDSGAIPEIVTNGKNGFIVTGITDRVRATALAKAIGKVDTIDRSECRDSFMQSFTLERMASNHRAVYKKLIK